MARTVADAAKVYAVIAGFDPADAYSAATIATGPGRARPHDRARGRADRPRDQRARRRPGVTRLHRRGRQRPRGTRAPHVDEVEIPDLFDLIVATSMYTDRSKHDLDLFLVRARRTRRSPSLAERLRQRPVRQAARPDGRDHGRPGRARTTTRTTSSASPPGTSSRSWSRTCSRRPRRDRLPERAGPAADARRPRRLDDADAPDEHADRLPDVAARDHGAGRVHARQRARRARVRRTPVRARRRCSGSRYAYEQAHAPPHAPPTASSPA